MFRSADGQKEGEICLDQARLEIPMSAFSKAAVKNTRLD